MNDYLIYLPLAITLIFILVWAVYSTKNIKTLKRERNFSNVNEYTYDSIPTVFTSLGVLGTFLGIFIGLLDFDVKDISGSIPNLLEGLKTAFSTSILGIFLSIIYGNWSKRVLNNIEDEPVSTSNESILLKEILEAINKTQLTMTTTANRVVDSINGDGNDSIATHFVKLRNKVNDQNKNLSEIKNALGGGGETSLLTQMQKLRSEQNDHADENKKNVEFIVSSMNKNNELIKVKFDEFSELLAKSNTEALVEVMKQATEEFNKQMSDLVNKLVQENFSELNNSVKNLNDWQKENKEMISSLTNQFKQVSNEFSITSKSINEITENTTKLTDKNSHLSKLIKELQIVMVDDTKFQDITKKLVNSIESLELTTKTFDSSSDKLHKWIDKQKHFSDSVARLLVRLEEIEKIKDINNVFWNKTKEQLNEGVSLISSSSEKLNTDLKVIDQMFYDRLNVTLTNLDTLIKSIIQNYKK